MEHEFNEFLSLTYVLLALWQHPGLLHKRRSGGVVGSSLSTVMANILVTNFAELSKNI